MTGLGCSETCSCTACSNLLNDQEQFFGSSNTRVNPCFLDWIRQRATNDGRDQAFKLTSPDNENFLLSTLLRVALEGTDGCDQPKSLFNSGYQEKLYSLRERCIAANDSTAEKEEVKRAIFREGLGIENASDGYDTVSNDRYFWSFCRGQPGANGY